MHVEMKPQRRGFKIEIEKGTRSRGAGSLGFLWFLRSWRAALRWDGPA
jgi:hypothetical protein